MLHLLQISGILIFSEALQIVFFVFICPGCRLPTCFLRSAIRRTKKLQLEKMKTIGCMFSSDLVSQSSGHASALAAVLQPEFRHGPFRGEPIETRGSLNLEIMQNLDRNLGRFFAPQISYKVIKSSLISVRDFERSAKCSGYSD